MILLWKILEKFLRYVVCIGLALATFANIAFAKDLFIIFDDPSPVKKTGFVTAVKAFEEAHPEINVRFTITDGENYKTTIHDVLSADAPDITIWYPGNRMAPLVDARQLEDISDLWANDPNLSKNFVAIKPVMTRHGRQWGVPYSYYQWGVYYRADIFEQHGIGVPTTWSEFLSVCDTLKANGITPFAIGTKHLWTAAGIFDYLNFRTNGYDVHNDLTAGKIKYSDPRIRKTFTNWRTMLEHCSFVDGHESMSWREALAPFVEGDAAMYVMGNFIVPGIRDAGLADSQIDFFQFPSITPGLLRAEDAPADAFFIPARAKNKEDARKFLSFIARPEIQGEWNRTISQLPPNSRAPINKSDKFVVKGFETVSTASRLAQFYDRDAPAAMAKAGMLGFQEFMINPDRLDQILKRLDRIQERVYE